MRLEIHNKQAESNQSLQYQVLAWFIVCSSSYSSLDWVLSHWALCVDSCVYVFFALYCLTAYVLYYCNTVGWTW